MARQIVLNLEASDPRFLTPFGVAETGLRDGRDTQEALARLHSGGSLNRSHAFAAEGGGSFAAPTGRALSFVLESICDSVTPTQPFDSADSGDYRNPREKLS